MNLIDCTELCDGLSALYPNANLTEKSPAAYHLMLNEFPQEAVLAIIPDVLREHTEFCPTPAAIYAKLKETLQPAVNMQEAWERVLQAMQRCGCMNQVCAEREINDPIIWRAAKTIGWYRIGTTEFKDHDKLYPQFKGALQDALDNAATEQRQEKIDEALSIGTDTPTAITAGSWKKIGK